MGARAKPFRGLLAECRRRSVLGTLDEESCIAPVLVADRRKEADIVYLSNEERRQRVIEVVRRETGVDCPELEVVRARARLGGGIVFYRCEEDAPSDSLILTPEDARYVGIDMSVRSRSETGG